MRNSERGIARFIKRSGNKLRLSNKDRRDIKNNLVAFMNQNPGLEIDCGYSFADFKYQVKSLNKHILSFFQVKYVPAYFSLLILFGAGVSYASERALPGETLYRLKGISERARPIFAFSDKDRAEMHLLLANRRLGEIKALYQARVLNSDKLEEVENSLENQIGAFKESINALKNSGELITAARISGEFKLLMNSHKLILRQLPEAKGLKRILDKLENEERKWADEGLIIESKLINNAKSDLAR